MRPIYVLKDCFEGHYLARFNMWTKSVDKALWFTGKDRIPVYRFATELRDLDDERADRTKRGALRVALMRSLFE